MKYNNKLLLKEVSSHAIQKEWDLVRYKSIQLLSAKNYRFLVAQYYLQALRMMGKAQEVILFASKILDEVPDLGVIALEKAMSLVIISKYQEALYFFYKSINLFSLEEHWIYYAKALFMAGDADGAYRILYPMVDLSGSTELYVLAGNISFSLYKYSDALFSYERAIANGSRSYKIFYRLGVSYKQVGRVHEARSVFKYLVDKNSMDDRALSGLGLCEIALGNHQAAIDMFVSSPLWLTKNVKILQLAASCALNNKDYLFAQHVFEKLFDKYKSFKELKQLDLILGYGYSLERQSRWADAEKVYAFLALEHPSFLPGVKGITWMFGVGLSSSVSVNDGLKYVSLLKKMDNSQHVLEIISACEARIGNFKEAYRLQEFLARSDANIDSHKRRQRVLRSLRKREPISSTDIIESSCVVAA